MAGRASCLGPLVLLRAALAAAHLAPGHERRNYASEDPYADKVAL